MTTCAVEGCEKPRKSHRGKKTSRWCSMHAARAWRHGDVNVTHRLGEQDWISDPAYRTAHKRIRTKRGPAADYSCVTCGGEAAEWAYDHRDPDERIDSARGLAYSDNPDHYQPMCRKCHAAFDDSVKPKTPPPRLRGEDHASAKVTESDVREIRAAVAAGEVGWSIAARYGICVNQVSKIAQRKSWAHVV